jgi:hypothetical protein
MQSMGFWRADQQTKHKKTHQKRILASKTRKKCKNTPFGHDNFSKSLLMSIHMTHHIFMIATRIKCFEITFS